MTEHERMARALREVIRGEVRADEVTRHLYASSASIFRAVPKVVVAPRDAGDVAAVVRFAAREGIPITGRGAGTSRAGQDVGTGIVLDFSRHLARLVAVEGPDERGEGVAVVEPGIVLDALNEKVAAQGLLFGPDPSSSAMCTLGGMIGNNAGGPHTVRYGATRDHVLGLEVVLATGEVVEVGPSPPPERGWLADLYRHLSRERARIEARYPRAVKNSSGYNLKDLFGPHGTWNPHKVFVGSEGTLGLVTRARLRLVMRPTHKALCLAYLPDVAAVGQAVEAVLPHGPAAVEVVNRALLERVHMSVPELDEVLARPFEYLLYVEAWEHGEERARSVALACAAALSGRDARVIFDPAAQKRFWALRKSAVGLLYRIVSPEGTKPIALIEDGAVPPDRLAGYLPAMEKLLRDLGVEAHFFGHAGNGHLHINTLLDLRRRRDVTLAGEVLREGHRIIAEHGGVLSGEHGDGRLRTPFLRGFYGDLYDAVMVPVKRILDPDRLLNPGILVAEPGDPPWQDFLRYGEKYVVRPTGTRFDGDDLHGIVDLCHGCGKCRQYCPAFAATGIEAASARAKANLLREVVSGRLPATALFTPESAEVFDLCVNCKRCLDDCPTGIDIPLIAQEARRLLKGTRAPRSDWILMNHRPLSRLNQALAPLVNATKDLGPIRAAIQACVGLDRRRPLPAFHRRPYPVPYETAGEPRGPSVLYFPGCNAELNDPEEGPATIALLEALGCRVLVPELRCCGIAQISLGYENRVLDDARENARVLAERVRAGVEVLFSQPSCRLAVQIDYPRMLPGDGNVASLEGHLHDALGFLAARPALAAELRRRLGAAPGPPIAYHQPCHARVLGEEGPKRLLADALGPRLRVLPDNCCGLSGTFGFKEKWYEVAQAIGRPQFEAVEAAGAAEVATPCGSCQHQLGTSTRRPARHPAAYLAEALGVVPDRGK